MENPIFVDHESILAIHYDQDHESDYDKYNKPNTSRVDVTTFMMPSCTDKQST